MPIIYFFYGLSFGGLGLAAFLQFRRGGDLLLRNQLPWLAAFGFSYAGVAWIDMFSASGMSDSVVEILQIMRIIMQPLSGLLMLRFGWGMLTQLSPLPGWMRIIPSMIIVPLAFVITYAATTFVTPSPIAIPIDIWSRYLFYLPGSIMAGIGFIRRRNEHRKEGLFDVSRLMFGAGLAFLFEAFVVGLIVPAAPYGPLSYYNYDRIYSDSFTVEQSADAPPFSVVPWLDYDSVLAVTGLPIQFWRLLSATAVIFFVVRGLDVFDAVERRRVHGLREERDKALLTASKVAESWTEALVSISRRIAELDDLDSILMDIVTNTQVLLNSDYVAIGLPGDNGQSLQLRCYAVSDAALKIASARGHIISSKLIKQVMQSLRPYCSDGTTERAAIADLCYGVENTASAAAIIPLALDNLPIGAVWSVRFSPEYYSSMDLIGLERMADQAVIAIQHGLMAAQLQSLAVVDERARIAREMHDGLAQILGYMNLQVQTLEALLKQNKHDLLFTELHQMREAIHTAHADVRENILSLRTTLASEGGIVSSIEEYLTGFSLQTDIDAQFDNLVEGELGLSPLAEVQMGCILQEALANVRKHAQAAKVMVVLSREDDQINLTICDDGIGFTQPVPKNRFGLHTMQERAHSVGGQVSIHSDLGKGTCITCRINEVRSEHSTSFSEDSAKKQQVLPSSEFRPVP